MELKEILAAAGDTDELIIGYGSLDRCLDYIKQYWPNSLPVIIADTNTWKAAGVKLSNSLKAYGIQTAEALVFKVPPFLHADYKNVDIIEKHVSNLNSPLLIAIGSGTINDLVKRAAYEIGTSYICIGTAASMDGYCSSGAALSKDGRKQTMECPAPKVIIADTEILETAPAEASAAGYADLASKLTAGADWLIADFTGDDPIKEDVWNIIQPNLNRWLATPRILSNIFEGLNYSGLAMQVLGRSRAASGAEHLLSHIWEMSGHLGTEGYPVSHGFQVSIGILCVTALTEEVFSMEACDIDIQQAVTVYPEWEDRAAEIEQLMSSLPSWWEYLDICRKKHLNRDQLQKKLKTLKTDWNSLKTSVQKKLPNYQRMKAMLETAGCPVKPEDINMSRETAIAAFQKAQCMRNRYTVLDLAYELGIFSKCITRIQNSNRYLY